MSKTYRTVSVLDHDWERLKMIAIRKRKPLSILVTELLDFYEAHHGNGEKGKPKRKPFHKDQEA